MTTGRFPGEHHGKERSHRFAASVITRAIARRSRRPMSVSSLSSIASLARALRRSKSSLSMSKVGCIGGSRAAAKVPSSEPGLSTIDAMRRRRSSTMSWSLRRACSRSRADRKHSRCRGLLRGHRQRTGRPSIPARHLDRSPGTHDESSGGPRPRSPSARTGRGVQACIPSEGGAFWWLSWRLSTGMSYYIRTGLDYGVAMRHEHVNTAPEIVAIGDDSPSGSRQLKRSREPALCDPCHSCLLTRPGTVESRALKSPSLR